VAFAVFGDASSVTRFAAAVLPLMNLHGRVNVFVGRFSALARPDALTPFNDPDAQTTRWFCASCEALERESKLRSWIIPLRFIQGSIFFAYLLFFRITIEKLFAYTEFAFCALQLEGSKGGRHFGGLPRDPPFSAAKSCYSMIMSYLTFPGACRVAIALGPPLDRNWAASAFPAGRPELCLWLRPMAGLTLFG
jgi:hypothetical protein